ncbi:cell division cycle 7-related protein kinase [Aplysia californica]|uniref:non-specific serine/threonine protein kinase n=1 Tax=Aplysia californica TaxID=6500 RepID=A0ABM0ZUL3_APLCA|nr:cell division cycle 7-related protein kinase [Aplysia californica]
MKNNNVNTAVLLCNSDKGMEEEVNADDTQDRRGKGDIAERLPTVDESPSGASAMLPPLPSDLDDEINDLYRLVPEVGNHFTILNKIGEGAFSTVYKARLKHYPEIQEMFALKHIVPTSHPSRIENELRCLLKIGGQDNVMGVKLCLRNKDHVIVVMPLFSHDKFQDILPVVTVSEVREYMRNLMTALRRVHEFNVIHRDIKPSNFLYNRQKKEYALVDFGLASGTMLTTPKDEEGCEWQKLEQTTTSAAAAKGIKPADTPCTRGKGRQAKDDRSPLSPSKKAAGERNKSNIVSTVKSGLQLQKAGPSWQKGPMHKPSFPPLVPNGLCDCYGKPVICQLCVGRNNQLAPRAGTAGFRAPEVLMKSPDQSTAVDIWSAGVIFLSILSGRYPFFRAQDDMGYLAQIVSLLGTEACVQAASSFGKLLTLSEQTPTVDLRSACLKLRGVQTSSRAASSGSHVTSEVRDSWAVISDTPFDLLEKMLDPNPSSRISAKDALQHPFFAEEDEGSSS